jgi:NADH-quinone oxidoreductase subunit F
VIVAIGEQVDDGLLVREGLETTERGNVSIGRYSFKTNLRGVYAIGDVVTGPSTAAEAMGYAKDAASVIDYDLTGKKRFDTLFEAFSYTNEVPAEIEAIKPVAPRHLKISERKGNFAEVNRGYLGEQARQEASRCLRCDIRNIESKEVAHA